MISHVYNENISLNLAVGVNPNLIRSKFGSVFIFRTILAENLACVRQRFPEIWTNYFGTSIFLKIFKLVIIRL